MIDFLRKTLEPLGYPVKRQGSIAANEKYPQHFFTYWNNDSTGDSHYDNSSHSTLWDFDLNFYSTKPSLVLEVLTSAKELLEANGFIVYGKGHDVASDEITHTGRGIHVLIIET